MNTLYLDLASGISGDMFLGALLDLGADRQALERRLAHLPLEGYHLHVRRDTRGTIEGTKFDVHLEANHAHEEHASDHPHPLAPTTHPEEPAQPVAQGHSDKHKHSHPHSHSHEPGSVECSPHGHGRTFADIQHLIQDSPLSPWVKQKSIAVFRRIADAEGKVHGQAPESVQFHEVGAVDSIVDIVGACLVLEQLGKPRVLASAVVEGTGWMDCAHGRLPIPAPATLEILSARRIPITQCAEPHELVTPTGAALLAEFAESFGPLRHFAPARVGYGLGSRETQSRPNVLRVVQGEPVVQNENGNSVPARGTCDWESDVIATLQSNLDDVPAEMLGRLMELALAQGAMDVFFTPIQMKKNRPGTLLTVLCDDADTEKFSELILRETTAFGVRRFRTERRKLRREVVRCPTPYGEVAVKLGRLNGQVIQASPEFESCKQVAEQAQVPLKRVYEAAVRAMPPG